MITWVDADIEKRTLRVLALLVAYVNVTGRVHRTVTSIEPGHPIQCTQNQYCEQ